MSRRDSVLVLICVAVFLWALALRPAEAHLCDNVFRQADMLVVKPEIANIIVRESIRFKLFLQNNMDRGIAQIRLGGQSPVFDVHVSPDQQSVPKGARVFFEVELKAKPGTRPGRYPLDFRLYAVKGQREQEFTRFRLGGAVAYLIPRLAEPPEREAGQEGEEQAALDEEGAGAIQVDGKVREQAWRSALVLSSFFSTDGKPADPQTVVLALFDSRAFYCALTCLEAKEGQEAANDSITLCLNPYNRAELYLFTVTREGALEARVRSGSRERALSTESVSLKLERKENEWLVEMALPWTVFGMEGPPGAGEAWRLNIVRQRAAAPPQTSFWAGSPGQYARVENYGQLFFAPEP